MMKPFQMCVLLALANVYVHAANKVECYTTLKTKKGCTACWIIVTYIGGRTVNCLRGNFAPPEHDGIKAVLNQCMKNAANDTFLYCNTNLCNQECIVTTTKPPPTTTTRALSSETEEPDEDVAMGGMFSSGPSRSYNLIASLIIAIIAVL